ncbi:hypothetical protein ES703_99587 [subsurface metagenome]
MEDLHCDAILPPLILNNPQLSGKQGSFITPTVLLGLRDSFPDKNLCFINITEKSVCLSQPCLGPYHVVCLHNLSCQLESLVIFGEGILI